jgi:hypothetical protein
MDALGITTTNGYDLYERGVSVIRFDRARMWADAFGIPEQDFIEEVLEPDGWSIDEARAYLEAAGLPPEHVESRLDVLEDLKPLSRRGAAEAFVLIWRKISEPERKASHRRTG